MVPWTRPHPGRMIGFMTAPDPADPQRLARECVTLVATQFSRHLDWSLNSLDELDTVCEALLVDGPLPEHRLQLWWELIGAYTGEVLIRAHGGQWNIHESSPDALAVSVNGMTAFPFSIAYRVLRGEPFKSLASFGRALPAISERGRTPD